MKTKHGLEGIQFISKRKPVEVKGKPVRKFAKGGPVQPHLRLSPNHKESDTPRRNLLPNYDPARKDDASRIPNVYRGRLQPDFESGNSLPETLDPNRMIRI